MQLAVKLKLRCIPGSCCSYSIKSVTCPRVVHNRSGLSDNNLLRGMNAAVARLVGAASVNFLARLSELSYFHVAWIAMLVVCVGSCRPLGVCA